MRVTRAWQIMSVCLGGLLSSLVSGGCWGAALTPGAQAAGPLESVAVMGDSLATGAGTNPQLSFDADQLWDLFKGEVALVMPGNAVTAPFAPGPLAPPVLLWHSPREYRGALDWVYAHLLGGLAKVYLDTPQYSWGYLAARGLGAPATHIYLTAGDGEKAATLVRQGDRLLEHLDGQLPRRVLIMYSGNDLCAGRMEELTSPQDYGNALQRGLQYLVRNGKPHPQGTQVYLAGFLGVTQVLTNKAILAKEVEAYGEKTTCKELRERGFQPKAPLSSVRHPESLYFQQFIPPNPTHICPTLFALPFFARSEIGLFNNLDQKQRERKTANIVDGMISDLAGRVRLFRQKAKQVAVNAQQWSRQHFPEKAITFAYIPETEYLHFEAEDIAADCFHLSVQGQARVAKAVLEGVMSQAQLKAASPSTR